MPDVRRGGGNSPAEVGTGTGSDYASEWERNEKMEGSTRGELRKSLGCISLFRAYWGNPISLRFLLVSLNVVDFLFTALSVRQLYSVDFTLLR